MCYPVTLGACSIVIVVDGAWWARCRLGDTCKCVSVDPGSSMVLVSPFVSLVAEGTVVVRGNRGLLPSSTSVRILNLPPPSPEHAPTQANAYRAQPGNGGR